MVTENEAKEEYVPKKEQDKTSEKDLNEMKVNNGLRVQNNDHKYAHLDQENKAGTKQEFQQR